MSAIAPLGSPSRNTGSVDAADTRATITGLVVSVVISQAEVNAILELLDAVSPRSVLRDLNEELRRILAEAR